MASFVFLAGAGAFVVPIMIVFFSDRMSSPVYADADLVRRMCEQFRDLSGDEDLDDGPGGPFEHCKSCLYEKAESEKADACGLTEMLFNCAVSALASALQITTQLIDDDYPADDPRRDPLQRCLLLFRTSGEVMGNAYPYFRGPQYEYERGRAQVSNARAIAFQGCIGAFDSTGVVPEELLRPMTEFDDLCNDIWLVTDDLRFSSRVLCATEGQGGRRGVANVNMIIATSALPPVCDDDLNFK